MHDELQHAMSKLKYDDLKIISQDLSTGFPLLKNVVSEQIKKLEESGKACATCGQSLKEIKNPFTLVFGPAGLRKKASFCAIDCLTYFTDSLKEMKQTKLEGITSKN